MPTRREWMVLTGLTGLVAASGPLKKVVGPSAEPAPGAATGAPTGAATESSSSSSLLSLTAPEAPPPWWAFAPLREGDSLAAGWSLASLSPVREGRAALVLEHEEGHRAEIHMRAHEPSFERLGGAGIAQSRRFDFLLMNGSRGEEETRETLGRLILGLAAHVRRNELRAPEGVMASFTSHRENSFRSSSA